MTLLNLSRHGRYPYRPINERPDFSWPGGKRLAFCICNNAEVFSFRDGLGVDSAWQGAPQTHRNYAWRDYGNRVGIWYLFDLLDELDLPMSHNFNALLFEECPQIAERALRRGDEFIGHGRTNAERQDVLDEAVEKELIAFSADTIARHTGKRPTGWLGPYLAETPVTLDLLKEAGFRYTLDWPADDQPFWMSTRAGPILSVPYTIEINDGTAMIGRQESALSFERMMIDQFEEMLVQSRKYPLVYTICLHPFLIGMPYRLRAFRRALATILKHRDDIWITTPGAIAEYYTASVQSPE